MRTLRRLSIPLLALAVACAVSRTAERSTFRWVRGNTHTHTLWSDGDGAPEEVVSWYREHGYGFLVLSDHNVLARGERWFPVGSEGGARLTPQRLASLRERFGDAVRVREREGGLEMRLVPLSELRERFEQPGEFVLITGEEITASASQRPVHVNGVNLVEAIDPPTGDDPRAVMQAALDAVVEQSRRTGRPMLAHVNHPNYGWSLDWRDLAAMRGERFFEVWNGHPSVRNLGDAEHPGTEEMWDRALTLRLTETDLGLLHGIASDDSHHYHDVRANLAVPGRGWVMVRVERVEPDAIVEALRNGDFYASSGVLLEDVRRDGDRLLVDIAREDGVQYSTRFLGTRRTAAGTGPIGETLLETEADPAVYHFRGDELYVRAVVTSSRPHPRPSVPGERERAWVQPQRP